MSSWFQTYGFASVHEHLLIGAYPLDRRDVQLLARIGIVRVLNLTADEEYGAGERAAVAAALQQAGIEERRAAFTDFGRLPADQLEAAVRRVNGWLDERLRTYLHCRAGWQRSAAVAAGVLAVREGLNADEALAFVNARKPSTNPLPHQREDLRQWLAARGEARWAPTDAAPSGAD